MTFFKSPHVERIHLRTISEGKAHPASTKSALLEYQNPSHSNSYMIQPSGDLLGIVFETHDKNHLVVWNWKTGERLLVSTRTTYLTLLLLTLGLNTVGCLWGTRSCLHVPL